MSTININSFSFNDLQHMLDSLVKRIHNGEHVTTVFMCGPSARLGISFDSNRSKFVHLMSEFNEQNGLPFGELVFFDPELPQTCPNFNEQCRGSRARERLALEVSHIIVFLLGIDEQNLGLKTRVEFGLYADYGNVAVWAPESGFRTGVMGWNLTKEFSIPVTHGELSELPPLCLEVYKRNQVVPSDGQFSSSYVNIANQNLFYVDCALAKTFLSNTKGAVYMRIQPYSTRNYSQLAMKHNMSIRCANVKDKYIEFYRWNGKTPNMVPPYASAIGGGCAMILNPEHTKVLMVQEKRYGSNELQLKFPAGGREYGELAVESAVRELKEEIDLSVALQNVHMVGGYDQSNAREGDINDVFMTFLVEIPENTVVRPDGVEVLKCDWYIVDDIINSKVPNVNKFNAQMLSDYTSGKVPSRKCVVESTRNGKRMKF